MIEPNSPEFYMKQALVLAERGRFTVSPNPMVGCLIVKNKQIIGTGFHQRAGEPHAEIFALKEAGKNAHNADAYVTLEPCCHHGRTPPCTDALINAGIRRVFVACLDPNPLVAGKGINALKNSGIETYTNILETKAKALNKIFFHYITHKRPYVIIKWAMSLDGKTITHPNDNRVISDEACQQHAHEMRHSIDAILIGSKTAVLDNPKLTARHLLSEKQPLRIILSGHGELPLDLTLFSPELPGRTLLVTTEFANKNWLKQAEEKNLTLWILPANSKKQVDIPCLLKKLGEHQITSLLVEGGEQIRNSFFSDENKEYINEIHTYISPVFIGDREKKLNLTSLKPHLLGDSLCLVALLKP